MALPIPAERPPLSERQRAALVALWEHYRVHRFFPTQRELCALLKTPGEDARPFLNPLVQKGYLERVPGRHRGLRFTKAAVEVMEQVSEGQMGLPL